MKLILFDGVCNFCNATVNFILKHDKENIFRFSAQQSKEGIKLLTRIGKENHNLSNLVFIDNERFYEGADAIIQISKHLKGFPKIFYLLRFLPKKFNQLTYNFIAKNRYKIFGKRESCRIPGETEKEKFL